MFFCARSVLLPSHVLCLLKLWPAKASSRHALQKLWAQGVVSGEVITSLQIWQLNSNGQAPISKIALLVIVIWYHKSKRTIWYWDEYNWKGQKGCNGNYHNQTFKKFFSSRQIFHGSPPFLPPYNISTIHLFSTTRWRFLPNPATFYLLRSRNEHSQDILNA